MGLLSQLEAELASTLIDLDLLRQTTSESDPRTEQAERRVKVIEERIVAERAKLGIGAQAGSDSDRGFADIVGEYERLFADQLFAEEAYAAARAAYDISVAESRRNSRYLAIHVAPTLPERANEPQRAMIVALIGLFSGLLWAMLVLAAYALRDRR
jgi:capsular polysaccharide transport system permease protein